MPVMTLEARAARAFPEADHRAARCLTALREAIAQERAALREWAKKKVCGPRCGHSRCDGIRDVVAWLDAREQAEKA